MFKNFFNGLFGKENAEVELTQITSVRQIKQLMAKKGLSSYFKAIEPHIKSSIHVNYDAKDDGEIEVGRSKLGGMPDLPKETDWFCHKKTGAPLSFVCQVNFSEVKPYDAENVLPDKGMLYLFYDCSEDGMPWGFSPEDANGKVVFYYDGDMSELERKAMPTENENICEVFGAAEISFLATFDIPNFDDSVLEGVDFKSDDEKYIDFCVDLVPPAKILGIPDRIQGEMEDECEYVSNGLFCGDLTGYEEGKKRGLDKNKDRWRLLLQLSSVEELDMYWCDGNLYLWITKEDLASRKFGESWLILQCD